MAKVLIAAATDLVADFGQTLLGSDSLERVFAPTHNAALEVARSYVPSLVVIDGSDASGACSFIRKLRACPGTRRSSILALSRMGVDMMQLEVPLHILFVTFQAMKLSSHGWPVITEDIQGGCLQRLTARARFNEGLPNELTTQVVQQFCDEHRERYLLAFVYGYLREHDLMAVRTEAEKYLMLGALNLVECVAFVGTSNAS